VHLWAGHDDVALVDAASSGAPPGTLHELRDGDGSLQAAALRSSTHAYGVTDAVGLATALGRLPARLEIYAIEGGDFSLGASLSPAVARTVDALAERIVATSPGFPGEPLGEAGRRAADHHATATPPPDRAPPSGAAAADMCRTTDVPRALL
jgi:hypothetical protein